jgi:hypothetical protein
MVEIRGIELWIERERKARHGEGGPECKTGDARESESESEITRARAVRGEGCTFLPAPRLTTGRFAPAHTKSRISHTADHEAIFK